MKVLVTGATGFIGRRLARRLQGGGHQVFSLTRTPDKARQAVPGVEFHPWEAGKPISTELIRSMDAIVNLAGESVNGRWSDAKKARIMDSRIEITRGVVDAMQAAGAPKVLVNASAIGIYGDRGDEVLTEASAPGEGFLKDVVLRWEQEAIRVQESGARVALMRFGIIMGPEGGALQKLLPLFKLGAGGPIGNGKQWWAWVHIDDVTKSIEAALAGELSGVYNVTAPEPVRQKDFASALGKAVKRPALMPAPAFAMRLVQGEFADEILFSKRVLPHRLLDSGFRFDHPEVGGALRHLVSKEGSREDIPAHA